MQISQTLCKHACLVCFLESIALLQLASQYFHVCLSLLEVGIASNIMVLVPWYVRLLQALFQRHACGVHCAISDLKYR